MNWSSRFIFLPRSAFIRRSLGAFYSGQSRDSSICAIPHDRFWISNIFPSIYGALLFYVHSIVVFKCDAILCPSTDEVGKYPRRNWNVLPSFISSFTCLIFAIHRKILMDNSLKNIPIMVWQKTSIFKFGLDSKYSNECSILFRQHAIWRKTFRLG